MIRRPPISTLTDTRVPHPTCVLSDEMRQWLGTWRYPWFGEVRICPVGDGVEWRSAKSPRMHGMVSRLQGRHFLHWDDPAVDLDAWLDFSVEDGVPRLRMAKLDPDGDFSSDYEDQIGRAHV